jgi:hypothetical protein
MKATLRVFVMTVMDDHFVFVSSLCIGLRDKLCMALFVAAYLLGEIAIPDISAYC